MSPDEQPNIDLVAGITKGSLDWTKDQIRGFVAKLRDRSLAFIEDRETIELVREQRHSTEWQILSQYVKDKRLRIVAQTGLSLRKLEDDKEKVDRLRIKILKAHGIEGLHIAEAVQNEVLTTFIGIDSPLSVSPADMTNQIERLLINVEKYIVFVGPEDSVDYRVREIETRLMADVPNTLILYGCRNDARNKVHSIVSRLRKTVLSYEFTVSESKIKTIVIMTRESPPTHGKIANS
jgi:hypothetical protein